jgi:LacI family transcriptional regulator
VSAPPLTTIAADPRARGRQAAELVLQRVHAPDAAPRHTVAPIRLQVRASSDTALPPGAIA